MTREDVVAADGAAQDDASPHPSVAASRPRRVGARLLKALVLVSRFGLAAMFLLAAGAKLYTLSDFAANMSNLVPARWVWPVTLSVIALELLAAVLLIVPRTVRAGALLSAALLVGFAGYALHYVYVQHGEPLECGCFGGLIASQLGVSTALRNLALLIPAALVFFAYRARRSGALKHSAN
ncbi:MAG TPA: MauE/DoxX family redox-associated membrane protein [Pyrinomonadaceae bacterium]|nr:MauE/DoxX family redox-associated membrane protein [Pyrinomonadaceae bacterium]